MHLDYLGFGLVRCLNRAIPLCEEVILIEISLDISTSCFIKLVDEMNFFIKTQDVYSLDRLKNNLFERNDSKNYLKSFKRFELLLHALNSFDIYRSLKATCVLCINLAAIELRRT